MQRDRESMWRVIDCEVVARVAEERNMLASKRVERVFTWVKVRVLKSIRVEAASFPPSEMRKPSDSSFCHG